MPYLVPFDPWRSDLCTCPPKYTLNPYTGCEHRCLYCYATSFIKNFYYPRPKKNFLKTVEKELSFLPEQSLVSLSNSSDPYQPLEERLKLTRSFLELAGKRNLRVLIITKSDLVLRDLDLLKKLNCAVTLTLTSKTLDSRLEPGAPSFGRRLEAIKILHKEGIPVGARLDPILPYLNEEEILEIAKEVAPFVKHITVSTYKARPDSLKRLTESFPKLRETLEGLYYERGIKVRGYLYLEESLRRDLIARIHKILKPYYITFATCRENLIDFRAPGLCDGSHLLSIS